MEIRLAGFNVDAENINQLREVLSDFPEINKTELEKLIQLNWTPETISASYARISRYPDSISELREKARFKIDKARKSNQTIIFDMGHSSIAEHAVFNFDIMKVSRLAAEYLEKTRLASFTEKSQRYIKIGKDILYPKEFGSDPDFNQRFVNLTDELFTVYNTLHDRLLPYFLANRPENVSERDTANLAKEDARYILPLAVLTQIGLTINARSLEKVIRNLKASPLMEMQEIGETLCKVVAGYAPSLVKYIAKTDYEALTYPEVKSALQLKPAEKTEVKEVRLIHIDEGIEDKILAALTVRLSCLDYGNALQQIKSWDSTRKKAVLQQSVKYLNSYHSLPREYEMGMLEFGLTVSASAFAQLKRHRMLTLIDGLYSPSLGVTLPQSIIETGQKDFFLEKMNRIETLYQEALAKWGEAANYLLTNAHRRNVIIQCNFRELVNIARLRCDVHAQWDIRHIANEMILEAQSHLPIIGCLLCGKDRFTTLKHSEITTG